MRKQFGGAPWRGVALVSGLALAACGGGAAGVDEVALAQQTAVAPASYGGGSVAMSSFTLLNTVRTAAGAGAVQQDVALDAAAQAHSAYLLANPAEFGHAEEPGRTGFSGQSPAVRLAAAGYRGDFWNEGVTGYARLAAPQADGCVAALLNSMYHLSSMLGPYRDLGVGYQTDGSGAGYCVLDYASKSSPQYPAAGTLISYPYAGQTGVPASFLPAAESPRPPSALAALVGQPIYAGMGSLALVAGDGSGKGSVSAFTLSDASGTPVPAFVLAPPSITVAAGIETLDDSANQLYYQRYEVFLVPKAALKPSVSYTVSFTGRFNGVAHEKRWSFTTGN